MIIAVQGGSGPSALQFYPRPAERLRVADNGAVPSLIDLSAVHDLVASPVNVRFHPPVFSTPYPTSSPGELEPVKARAALLHGTVPHRCISDGPRQHTGLVCSVSPVLSVPHHRNSISFNHRITQPTRPKINDHDSRKSPLIINSRSSGNSFPKPLVTPIHVQSGGKSYSLPVRALHRVQLPTARSWCGPSCPCCSSAVGRTRPPRNRNKKGVALEFGMNGESCPAAHGRGFLDFLFQCVSGSFGTRTCLAFGAPWRVKVWL